MPIIRFYHLLLKSSKILIFRHMPRKKKLPFIVPIIPKFSSIIKEKFELEMFSFDHKREILFSFEVWNGKNAWGE